MLEGRAGVEATSLMLQLPLLRLQAKRGQGQPVLVLPGFMTDDTSTIVLRTFLSSIGYKTQGWGLGINNGRMMDLLPPVYEKIKQIKADTNQKVILVGWSRGGIISREIARDYPQDIDRVITIGSPGMGGIEVSSIGDWVRKETGLTPVMMKTLLRQRQSTPITVPIRSIYSRLDGVVAWQACLDHESPDVEHFEIHGTHIGMGTNAEVFRLLTKLLRG
jgi:pimeloyl-ACP methyl ester carboxylesterase